ncbi:MAG TPA: hypothetical protein VGR28_07975 [Candidatus Thermoplasmatota archaeon]|jgi:hypothetical protein|nr:hypothetical protein [Candidatus Thermoplasmatota archaeon]
MRLGYILGLALVPVVAGCLAPAAPLESTAPAAASLPTDALAPVELTWEGYMVAGAASEIPAHFSATETAVAPLWKSGFNLMVEEVPQVVEIMVDWTAASPTQLMFMAHVPHDEATPRDWWEYEYPSGHMTAPLWPAEGPLCMRIPSDEVAPGHWHIMSHSRYGADIRVTFTITTVGGVVSIPDGEHGHALDAEEVQQIAEVVKTSDWLPCELSPA